MSDGSEFCTLNRNASPTISLEAVRMLDDIRQAMDGSSETVHAAAMRLVTLLRGPAKPASMSARGGLAPWQKRKIDRYVSEHLDRALHVDEIARQVSLSVSHFSCVFKETYGTTPHLHLIRLRLALAQQLMLGTNDPLSRIALACGMADQAHFTKLFHREVGETPYAWRRRNLGDPRAEGKPACDAPRHPASTGIPAH